MAVTKCPNCAREFVRRVPRDGVAEILLGLVYVYPFKCQLCGERFRSFQRGVRYKRVEEDRREYYRMEMKFPVVITGQDQLSSNGLLLNLSMGGCSFSTDADLAIGMIVKIELAITGAVPPVIVDAAVVRDIRTGIAGVEFLRWQETERERLQLFIRGLLISHGAESNRYSTAPNR
jgi:hypothetical protein